MNLGFIGLGTMGTAMATHLLRSGYTLRVWNRSSGPAARLQALGAQVANTPAEVAQDGTVIAMLADDAATQAVLLDAGVLAAVPRGGVLINTATLSPAVAQELAARHEARGVDYIAAPVFGRPDVAQAGKLQILAAGSADVIERVRPLLETLGQKLWYFGEQPARANVVKLAANFMIASAIEAMGEAATLTHGYGIEPAAFLEMISSTLFAAQVYQGYGKRIAQRQFEPAGFKLPLGLKDIRLALQAAEAVRVPMPFASVLRDSLLEGMAHGQEQMDWSSLARTIAQRAGQG
jgi:3-hydroxyisobutyrate dehydrogenase-like beta-hydroxyacid dehydrogenase